MRKKGKINSGKPPEVIHLWKVEILRGRLMRGDDHTDKKELRSSPRIPLDCRLFFSSTELVEADATLLDLSSTGCAAESETTVRTDMNLDLWIFSPNYNWRMHINHAVVRWVRGQVFGVEFLNLRPVQRKRLRQLVEKFRAQ
ncbi:MAG: PilZ domain-containing protein [Nitrospira sp.]|nr:MAG: PilZ domain-containing protein [Nitrospira sp.]